MRAFRRPAWRRCVRGGHVIATRDALMRRVEERSLTRGQSLDEAAAVVVADLENAAAALNARIAPLVPGCGVLVAVTGLLLKAEPSSDSVAEYFLGFGVLCAVAGLALLIRALVVYVGRRAVGLSPMASDIAFARDCLARKHGNARRGGWLAGIAITCLILGILLGVHLSINA
jgi:hypothetical protein